LAEKDLHDFEGNFFWPSSARNSSWQTGQSHVRTRIELISQRGTHCIYGCVCKCATCGTKRQRTRCVYVMSLTCNITTRWCLGEGEKDVLQGHLRHCV